MTPIVQVNDLRKRYGEIEAVRGISFFVEPGQVFGLLGPNGAGKTTTVEILEGLRKADGGSATVAGVDVFTDPAGVKRRIGVLEAPRGVLLISGRTAQALLDQIQAAVEVLRANDLGGWTKPAPRL